MVLTAVRKSLRARREATFTQLAAETGLSPAMLRSALDYWIDRGNIEEITPTAAAESGASTVGVKCAACPLAGRCTIPPPKRPRSCHIPPEGTLFVWRESVATAAHHHAGGHRE